MRNKQTTTRSGKSKTINKSRQSLLDLLRNKLPVKAPKEKLVNFLHVSKTFKTVNGKTLMSGGMTYDIGRNKAKKEAREGKPRKHWRVI